MFLGTTSSRSSGDRAAAAASDCASATATAFLASDWPTICSSSAATMALGVRESFIEIGPSPGVVAVRPERSRGTLRAACSRPRSTRTGYCWRLFNRLHRQPVVGEHAHLGGDRHGAAGELFGVGFIVGQRLRRGERIIAARADRGDPALGLEHVAVAGQDQHRLGIGDDHHRLEVAEVFVGPPVLGQLDRGAQQLAAMRFQFLLEPLEQGEGVGGGAGEAADHLAPRRRAGGPSWRWASSPYCPC